MKTMNKILLGLAAASVALVSCDLTQPTPSSFDESVVFSNPSLAEYNIFGIYQCLGETNCHRGRYLPWYGFNTDIECYLSTNFDGKNLDWAAYDCSPTNSNMNLDNGPYSKIMEGLERANLCVKYLRLYGKSAEMKPLLGEALTARAFLYTELMKAYGEVPARFQPVADSEELVYANKAERDVLFHQLLSDLEEAIELLDGVYPSKTDRVSKTFAEGLFARLALMASGYSLRPADGKTGTGDPGSVRLSSDPELSKDVLYPVILKYLDDAITSGKNSLYEDYAQLWWDFNNMDLTAGKEVIFSIPFSDTRGRWNYTFAVRKEQGSAPSWLPKADARGGAAGPTPYLYYKYSPLDQRRDVSCVNWKWNGDTPIRKTPAGQMNWYFGKFRYEWMVKRPYDGGNDDGIKPVYMRYSDILLMAAEVANYLGESQKAEDYFFQVRTRAFNGSKELAKAGIDVSSKEAMFQAIKDERALEFVGEMLRKQDLIRWNELNSSIETAKEEITKFARLEDEYAFHGPALWYGRTSDGEIYPYGMEIGETCDGTESVESLAAYFLETYGVVVDEVVLESKEYFKENDAMTKRIASLVKDGRDPEMNMWWPIPATVINNAQGSLVNDYVYAK